MSGGRELGPEKKMPLLTFSKVLITDDVAPSCLKILQDHGFHVDVKTELPTSQLLEDIKNYDALIGRSATGITSELLHAGKNLKVIGRAGTGIDNIDCITATKQGVLVINAPGANTISVAELACGLIIGLARDLFGAAYTLKCGSWERSHLMGTELLGKTLAIIGLGFIGKEVARRMQAFGMKVVAYDPFASPIEAKALGVELLSLKDLWPVADFITLHVPLIPQTKNMISKETFKLCKKGVKIINVARGGIVNETDLLEALESGQCAGAALDVFEQEPSNNTDLLTHPKIICTPHLGANTLEAQEHVATEIAEEFVNLVQNKPVVGVVNSSVLVRLQKDGNRPWFNLCVALGKLAGSFIGAYNSDSIHIEVTTQGNDLEHVGDFLPSGVCIGLLNQLGFDEVNFVNVNLHAEEKKIKMSHTHHEPESSNRVSVKVTSGSVTHSFSGTASDLICLLQTLDGAVVQPPWQLLGHAIIGVTENKTVAFGEVFASLKSENVGLLSCTVSSSNTNSYCLLSTDGPVVIKTRPPPTPLTFWTAVNF